MNIFFLIIILVILILFFIGTELNKKELNKKELFDTNLLNHDKIVFNLKTLDGLNLTYTNNNFYLTYKFPYIYVGILDINGLYALKDGIKNYNFILNYNIANTSESNIVLESNSKDNPNSNTITNIFNQTNKNIYLDPINKVIVSNDDSGNMVYLTNLIDGSSVGWNYNLDNATIFYINYL